MDTPTQKYDSPPGFMVVEGPIGVGKTSLTKRLAQSFSGEVILERPELNPFLERFYRAPKQYALPTQLSFLFQRSQMLKGVRQQDMFSRTQIADFLFEKDVLFAQLNLEEDEYRLYQQVYNHLLPDAPVPDLVIYLQAPVDVLLHRIRQRGVEYEQMIERDYLTKLCDIYSRMFLAYNQSPLLVVNAENINFVDNEADYHTLLEEIVNTKSGRHFFNPLSVG